MKNGVNQEVDNFLVSKALAKPYISQPLGFHLKIEMAKLNSKPFLLSSKITAVTLLNFT
jgi:hypothetical protein